MKLRVVHSGRSQKEATCVEHEDAYRHLAAAVDAVKHLSSLHSSNSWQERDLEEQMEILDCWRKDVHWGN